MIPGLTRSQINRLGERLRNGPPSFSDLELLDAFRLSFDEAQQTVMQALRRLGVEPSGRIKTTISIVEKLKRESIRLSRLQDIAGCRIVVNRTSEQDRMAAMISDALPETTLIDRRQRHSHGYRAIHIVADIEERLVEIQIRTELQHLWAIWSETLAAAVEQSIKYGGGPKEIQQNLTSYSKVVASLESWEQNVGAAFAPMDQIQAPSALDALMATLSGGALRPEALAATKVIGGAMDLIRLEQDVKDRLTREILNLKSMRRKL